MIVLKHLRANILPTGDGGFMVFDATFNNISVMS